MALLNIHVKLEGEAEDSFKYSPYMSRISYGLGSTSPLYFLPWVKITRDNLVALAKKLGLNSDDNYSLARMFLVPKYLAKMLDTFPRPVTSNAEEKRSVIVSNIRTLLSLVFPAGAPLYVKNRIFTIESQTWNGEYKEKDRRTPASRRKASASSKASSKTSSKTRKVSFKLPPSSPAASSSSTASSSPAATRSRAKKGGARGAEDVPFIYDIDVTLSVTLGRRPATFTRRLRVSCQTRRKALRKSIKDVFPSFDIGPGKQTAKSRPSKVPIMYSSTGYNLRMPYTRQSPSHYHPSYPYGYSSPTHYSGSSSSSSSPYTHSPYTHSPYTSFHPPSYPQTPRSTLAERARHAGVTTWSR